MIDEKSVEGSCYCEKVKFRVALPAYWMGHCHCSQCRRIHSAAFVTWVGFNTNDYQIIDPDNHFKTFRGEFSDRGFCSCCGSHFFFKYYNPSWPKFVEKEVFFARANINYELALPPAQNIYLDDKENWY